MIIKAGLHLTHEFAEPQHHAELVGFDPEKAGEAPEHDRCERNQSDAAAAEIAGHQSAQPVLAAAQKFFDIWRFRAPRS